ncbi:MAG TPA: glycosyltransferase family 4 protein [Verrucomicrobiae bacterium]
MKLALIRRRFAATGGAELYMQRLLEALNGGGHEVHLFAEAWEKPPQGVQFQPVEVNGSRADRPVNFAKRVQEMLAASKFDCVFSLERTLKQDVYRAGDGLHSEWLAARKKYAPWWKKPFIGMGAFHRNMLELEKRTFDPANTGRVIVNSNMVEREILRNFAYPQARIHLVRNGIEVDRFQNTRRTEARQQFGFDKNDFVCLFVGSGQERKGLRHVLRTTSAVEEVREALKELPTDLLTAERLHGCDWQLDLPPKLAPARPLKTLVVGKIRRPSGNWKNVLFAGPSKDVENAYAAADLFLFLPIYEPSSNVVCEALASGLPVITTACNGASELIEQRVNGSVIQRPDDISAALMETLYWMSARHHHLPSTNLAQLSLERNVAETMTILERTIGDKQK